MSTINDDIRRSQLVDATYGDYRSLLQQFPHWFPFISHERTACIRDSFVRPNTSDKYQFVERGYTRSLFFFPFSFSFPPHLFCSRSFYARPYVYNHLCLSPLSYFHIFSLSFILSLSLPGIVNIAVRCRYLYNSVNSISADCRCTEENRSKHAWCSDNDGEYLQKEWFLFSAISIFRRVVRAAGRFHRGGCCRVYVDL